VVLIDVMEKQRAALRDPATAAPRHWAAFVLVGAVR
jgi:CHAT domain-containing protein